MLCGLSGYLKLPVRDDHRSSQRALPSVLARGVTNLPIAEGRGPFPGFDQRGSEYVERAVSGVTVFQHTGGSMFRVSFPVDDDLAVRGAKRNVVENPLTGNGSGMQVD